MLAMHWAFRRDLDRFVAAVVATPVADRPAWRALAGRWALFRRVLRDHGTGRHDLDPLLDSVTDGLARLAGGADDDARAALEVRMAAARHRVTLHLGSEVHKERRHLTGVSGWRAPVVLAWVMHELPETAAARLPATATPARVLWRLFLRRPFARRERRVFRYPA